MSHPFDPKATYTTPLLRRSPGRWQFFAESNGTVPCEPCTEPVTCSRIRIYRAARDIHRVQRMHEGKIAACRHFSFRVNVKRPSAIAIRLMRRALNSHLGVAINPRHPWSKIGTGVIPAPGLMKLAAIAEGRVRLSASKAYKLSCMVATKTTSCEVPPIETFSHVKRLRDDISVHVVRAQLCEGCRLHVRGIQEGLIGIQSSTAIVVPVRQNIDLSVQQDTEDNANARVIRMSGSRSNGQQMCGSARQTEAVLVHRLRQILPVEPDNYFSSEASKVKSRPRAFGARPL